MNMTEKLINKINTTNSLILQPNIDDNKLTKKVSGINELNEPIDIDVVTEKPLTIYLNSQEIEYIDSGYRSMFSVQSSLVMFPIFIILKMIIP